jgi:hypothetical protein
MQMVRMAREAILARHGFRVARLAGFLFDRGEIGDEIERIALLIGFQVGATFLQGMAGEAAATVHDAQMRLMDEIREASPFALDRRRGEIDHPPFALEVVNAVAFRA